MKHVRKLTLLLAVLLACSCFSTRALAVFLQPRGLKEIGDGAFEGVPMPKNYDLLYGVERIGSRAFAGTGVNMFWLPETLQYIAPDAFDKGTAFTCSPGTYAETWCRQNGMDFDYIKPFLSADTRSLLFGETVTLAADYIYSKEPTEYFWETRGRERYWTPVPDENGPVLRYTNTEGYGYIRFRVSAVVDGVLSTPSDSVTISRYSGTLSFVPDKCRAISGDTVYLEWNYMGRNKQYELYQWALNPQLEEGGEWVRITETSYWYDSVYGLDPNTEYTFQLRMAGSSPDAQLVSDPVTVTTGTEKTTFQMREFSCQGNSVTMSWEPIHNAYYDIYIGETEDDMIKLAGNRTDTVYSVYGPFPVGVKRYLQVCARVYGAGITYWGPMIEATATEDGPNLAIDEIEVHGDTVTLQWTPLHGCDYDVYMSVNGGDEACVARDISRNYLDLGGFEPGQTAVFRVTASSGSWSNTSPAQAVTFQANDDIAYRALLIGEVRFRGSMSAPRNYHDVELLTEMLQNAKTPAGSHYSVTRREDLSSEGILSAIRDTFRNSDDNDVSLLFIAPHGDVTYTGRFAGNLSTVEVPDVDHGTLLAEDLAAELEKIKGTKVVWLGSCGSGSMVYDRTYPDEENISEVYLDDYDEDEWGDEWYDYDPNRGLSLSDSEAFDTGELRLPGFQVLTAARYRYMSYGLADNSNNFFPKYIADGLSGSMPADLNGDGTVTQHELFLYVKLQEDDPETGIYQDVQAYPYNSDYPLFSR